MKKIKLDSRKLQLRKETIAPLTNDQMGQVFGGQPVTTATIKNCCSPTTDTGGYCPPPSADCTGSCSGNCATGGCVVTDGDNCYVTG